MKKELEQLAEAYCKSDKAPGCCACLEDCKQSWLAGHAAAIKTLEDAAGEFDEKAAFDKAITQSYHWALPEMRPTSIDEVADGLEHMVIERIEMARGQFEQDRERIGLAERQRMDEVRWRLETLKELTATNARLENSKQAYEVADRELVKVRNELVSANERVKQLECEMATLQRIMR